MAGKVMPEDDQGMQWKCHCHAKATTRIDSFADLERLKQWLAMELPNRLEHSVWACCDNHVEEARKLNNERVGPSAIALVRAL